jgi:hypothetical protein
LSLRRRRSAVGRRRECAIELASAHRDEQVDGRSEPQRLPSSEDLEHEECGAETTEHSAERVEPIQDGDVLSPRVRAADHAACRGRQGAAHGHGRNGQDHRAQYQTPDRPDEKADARSAADDDVQLADERQEQGTDCRGNRDNRFELRVEHDRTRVRVSLRAEQEPADPKPADEDGQHRSGRGGRGTEDQPELTQPADLIHQRAGARCEE